MPIPVKSKIEKQVQDVLSEDIASGDVTASLIPGDKIAHAQLVCRESAILCGCDWFEMAFRLMDKNCQVNWYANDAQAISESQVICDITGNARALLSAERTGLNFLQTLSATATQTQQYVNAIKNSSCKILDTRKTIPGLRHAQKYAVQCGGGFNHRVGLYDMILIKENHIHAAGSISAAVKQARINSPELKIEVEVENLDELREALESKVDRILLDNMSITMLLDAVRITAKKIPLEASGNITLESIHEIAATGVDYISTGALTKNIRAIDFSLRFTDL